MWRTATQERGRPYEFGEWKPYDAACLEMIQITQRWEKIGLRVKRWGELYPKEATRNRLVGILPHQRQWAFTTEVVPND